MVENTVPANPFVIYVNTRKEVVTTPTVTFEQIVEFAFPGAATTNTIYTVVYRNGIASKPEGSLVARGSVQVNEGMIFNVSATTKS